MIRATHRTAARRVAVAVPTALALAGCGQRSITSSNRPAAVAPTTSAPVTASLKSGTYDGQIVQTRYGPVEIAVTVGAGRVTGIAFLAMPVDRPRSQSITQQAEPLLRSEALTAQSAAVNLLGGATYTSEGFAQSLQSALSQAH